MKKIILLLILFSSFALSIVDESKIDVYFGNGILIKEKDAKFNAEVVLKPEIISLYPTLKDFKKHIGKVDYAYNQTRTMALDLFESTYQVINLQDLEDKLYKMIKKDRETIHQLDLSLQVDKYENSIKRGHRVLVVAHSQGNLFAQEAYEHLGERAKWMQKYWEAVSIASPDPISNIKPDMPKSIGWNNDLVARLGWGFFKNGIDCNVVHVTWKPKNEDSSPNKTVPPKPKSPYVYRNNINGIYKNWWVATNGFKDNLDSNVHAFTFYMGLRLKEGDEKKPNYKEYYVDVLSNNSYLVDTSAKKEIMNAIDKQLKKLENLPSQWSVKTANCSKKRDLTLKDEFCCV